MSRDLRALSAEQAVRILDAKTAELEHQVKWADVRGVDDLHSALADIALVASLLAEFIERFEARLVLLEAHSENLIERVYALEGSN